MKSSIRYCTSKQARVPSLTPTNKANPEFSLPDGDEAQPLAGLGGELPPSLVVSRKRVTRHKSLLYEQVHQPYSSSTKDPSEPAPTNQKLLTRNPTPNWGGMSLTPKRPTDRGSGSAVGPPGIWHPRPPGGEPIAFVYMGHQGGK